MTRHLSIILLLTFLAACSQYSGPEPLKFKAYGNNPVLNKGENGAWDAEAVISPYLLVNDGMIYLFYTGWSMDGKPSIGMATSNDGYHFTRDEGNPVLTAEKKGFDAFGVASPVVLKKDSVWIMYFNAGETATFGPMPNIGLATTKSLAGTWEKSKTPILTRGHRSEWDGGYIFPTSILTMEDGSYRLYYTAGREISSIDRYIGMAISKDGITWIKYNDPVTMEHPFADSDPVKISDNREKKVIQRAWSAYVSKSAGGYEIYYCSIKLVDNTQICEIEHAHGSDGIHFRKSQNKPVYGLKDDPLAKYNTLEFPTLVRLDSVWLMYYDYGIETGSIGLALGMR